LEDREDVGESSCNSGDGTDQRVQSLLFMVMMRSKEILEDLKVVPFDEKLRKYK